MRTLIKLNTYNIDFYVRFVEVVTENGWILNFKFRKVVVGNVAWVLLQIYRRIQQWKNFENRPTFVKIINECIVAQFFFDSRCIKMQNESLICFLSILLRRLHETWPSANDVGSSHWPLYTDHWPVLADHH